MQDIQVCVNLQLLVEEKVEINRVLIRVSIFNQQREMRYDNFIAIALTSKMVFAPTNNAFTDCYYLFSKIG